MRFSAGLAFATVLTVKPAVALVAAGMNPGCLAGHSKAGLPYAAPAIACFALLWLGWTTHRADSDLWRLLSWASLLGASSFATTPLWRALDWHWPQWEPVPLLVVVVILLARFGLRSRSNAYRALGLSFVAAAAWTVAAPWIPFVAERYPWLVIGFGYGSLAALVTVAAYTYRSTRSQP